jgi:predicted phosphoribosyltransferase
VDPAFGAVGTYYHDFAPVRDEEVVAVLARANDRIPAAMKMPDRPR